MCPVHARLPVSEIPVAVPVYSAGCCEEPEGAQGSGRLRAAERPGDVGAGSAGLASSSVGKWGSRRYEGESWGAGDPGQPRALSSEGTGLGQRPSPGKYRMHFFFLLCWILGAFPVTASSSSRSCPAPTSLGRAACAAASPCGPAHNTWLALPGTVRATYGPGSG